jgi:ABC-type transport system involved in multi-copper enzyme maturation permease subunit
MKLFLEWNEQKKGTNLLTIGVILIFANAIIGTNFEVNKHMNVVIHYFGFFISSLGVVMKSVYVIYKKYQEKSKQSIIVNLFILNGIVFFIASLVFFIKFLRVLFN